MVGSLLFEQPRWLAGCWRLIGTVVAIACAFGAPFVLPIAFDPARPQLAALLLPGGEHFTETPAG